MKKYWSLLFLLIFVNLPAPAQSCGMLDLQHQVDISHICGNNTMTMEFDQLGRKYLYVAVKEGGLKIYDISDYLHPSLKFTIPISQMNGLDVMNVNQSGNYLYLSLGNTFFPSPELSGMAIVDVTDPTNPVVTDTWVYNGPVSGGGIVQVEGNYAYFGAMGNGLFIFDVSNKSQIDSVARFMPDLSFPTTNPDTPKYNARGMVVQDDRVYLCFDAGGIRIIDVTDKHNPVEIGAYSNPILNGKPRAYNNAVLDGSLLYVAIDYCGMEVLDVSDPGNIAQHGWWNPWGCNNNWFTSRGHTNEIEIDTMCRKIFLSTGRSDMYVVDITNPSAPDSCSSFGNATDTLGTWGVARIDNKVALSYICTLGIPFTSFYSGVKLFTYNNACSTGLEALQKNSIRVYPNPVSNRLRIETHDWIKRVQLINMEGQVILSGRDKDINLTHVPRGIYQLQVETEKGWETQRVVKM